MRVVYVQTYPAYHDFGDSERWLALENRDKWMAGITATLGHETELWCIAHQSGSRVYNWNDNVPLPIRMFKPDSLDGATKKHVSSEMITFAQSIKVDLFVLKGTDGGAGISLLRNHIIPKNIPFAFVIGGTWFSPFAHKAKAVLYETGEQSNLLQQSGWKFWQKPCDKNQLIHLPKSIDTTIFKPMEEVEKEYDIISMGRLIPYYKNYDALFALSNDLKIGFIGDGPKLDEYRKSYPQIDWLGHIPNHQIPEFLNKANAFFYTGRRDFFPRVIVEAAACGLPLIAFRDVIKEDVLPDSIGKRVDKASFKKEILAFCKDKDGFKKKGNQARKHTCLHWYKESAKDAIINMTERVVG